MTHTKDILADALMKAGLGDMSLRARSGYYHDYLSPLATPCVQLATDLKAVGTPAALALLSRHLNGDFDATLAESEDWINSADGKEALSQLSPSVAAIIGGKPKRH